MCLGTYLSLNLSVCNFYTKRKILNMYTDNEFVIFLVVNVTVFLLFLTSFILPSLSNFFHEVRGKNKTPCLAS